MKQILHDSCSGFMKIAHIVCTYPPYYGGMGNVVFQTAAELVKRGHTVEEFTQQYYTAEEVKSEASAPELRQEPKLEEQIDYARRLAPSFQYGNAARLPQLKKELDAFDVVHLHYPFFGTAGLVRGWKRRHPERPLVITYHMDTRGPGWKGLAFKLYSRFWMPRVLGAADKIIASSFDYLLSSDAGTLYREHPEKWVELPFGVDTERFHPHEAQSMKHETNVLFVGGMDAAHYFKGVPVLLNALALLKQKQNHFPTSDAIATNVGQVVGVFVGDGELRPRFELQAKALGLGNDVRFVGSVSDNELPEYYRNADLVVLPSTNRGEAFGMVLLEALASGVPVIASDLPGVRSLPGEAGVLVPSGDAHALADAIAAFFSRADRAELSARARGIAETRYAWEPIVERLEAVYTSL
jgi:glycosyltransferase involved in cell wall biosynthesis